RAGTDDRFVAAPPAARRILAARLGVRGFFRDPVPGVRGRRMGGRVFERGVLHARGADGAAEGAGGAVGARAAAFRGAGTADRIFAGMPALVGSLAEGQ